ncbi:MAG: TonB-dependent receptor [Acidobacteria bacterium]|nr:MAG: TonB-dependent receptor [Acidobacteriota bacterium]
MKTLLCALAVVGCLTLMFTPARGQGITGSQINGVVQDSSHAAVPGASIIAIDEATGATRLAKTGAQGEFVIPDLPVGNYDVTVTHQGFRQQTEKRVTVAVASPVTLTITLVVGSMSQQVSVTAQAPLLNKENPSIGTVFTNKAVTKLPINGQDYTRFALLTPGAVLRSNYISDLTFDGMETVHNQFSIDGIDASRVDQPYMANGFERGARLLTGSLQTISQFKVETSGYGAQFGRAAGSYINIVTKSGTNQFHGELFDFFRNDALDARNFFATDKPEFRYNDFGFNVGGPIVKNKTFFFLNYEGSRQRLGITGSGTVPSDSLRAQVLAKSPQLAPIVAMFPHGTSTTSDPNVNDFTTSQVSAVRENTGSIRIDQTLSNKDKAFVRVNINNSYVNGPLFGVIPSSLGIFDHQNVPLGTRNVAIQEVHVFSPNLINTFLGGMQRWVSSVDSTEPWPATTIVGYSVQPGSQSVFAENNTSFQYGDSMTYVRGEHTMTWGATMWRIWVNGNNGIAPMMQFNSPQDFINDRLAFVSISPASPEEGTRATQLGMYFNDSWRLRPNLTFTYGLRYDRETVPYDAFHNTRPFDTRLNTLAPAGSPYFAPNNKDFGPRLGLAWSPNGKTVVRAGYGIYYQDYPVGFGFYGVPSNTIPGNVTLLQQQIPTLSYPYDSYLSQAATPPPPNANGFSWNKPDIYSGQWNFSVARELVSNLALQVAYVGNHGVNLGRSEDINYINPATGLRPNPNFGDIYINMNSGFSSYNGLQVSLKKTGPAFTFQFNYTTGHAIDNVEDQGAFSTQPQDNNNIKAERGNGSGDVRHNVSFDALYNLPVGSGHNLFSHGAAGAVFSGWSLNALGVARSGIPVTVYIGDNPYGNGDYVNQRANCIPGVNPYAANKTVNNWLNPAAFAEPAAGTFGNCPRNSVYGPGFVELDTSLVKETPLGEGRNMELRFEAFNLFNHPNFAEPDTTFGTAGFGQIFQTLGATIGSGTPRQVQLGIKFSF